MGIRGFSSFIHSFDEFFEEIKLKDCKIIIDGNNLRYFLYHSCPKARSATGGDYGLYQTHVQKYFKRFLECNVSVTVVMDGAHDPSDAKKRTLFTRAKDKFKSGIDATWGNSKVQVHPLLAKDVFLAVVKSFSNTELIQTTFEADAFMASLAASEDCHLLSSDSDFFVQSTVRLISLGSINDHITTDGGETFINCRAFNRTAFNARYPIKDPKLLYLMATVLGNDYVTPSTFDRFFAQIRQPKRKSLSPKHCKMLGLLQWISREESVEGALEKVMVTMPKAERKSIQAMVHASMTMYEEEMILGGLEEEKNEISAALSTKVTSQAGYEIEPWFVEEFHSAKHSSWTMGFLCNDTLIFQGQVEDPRKPSSHLAGLTVAKETMALLTTLEKNAASEEKRSVKLLHREGRGCKGLPIVIERPDKNPLGEIRKLPLEKRIELFLSKVVKDRNWSSKAADQYPALKLFFLGVTLWTEQLTVTLNQIKLIALLLMPQMRDDVPTALADLFRSKISERFEKASFVMKCSVAKDGLNVARALAPLQAIFFQLNTLSNLLDTGIPCVDMASVWSGTFLFQLGADLEMHHDVDNRIEGLLGFDSGLVGWYKDVLASLEEVCRQVSNEVKVGGKGKKEKEAKKLSDLENKFAILEIE